MANPCIIIFKGTEFSHDEFMGMLHDGLLDNLVENKIIEMPVTASERAKAAKVGKGPSKMATKLLTHLGIEPTGPEKPVKKYTAKNLDTINTEGLNDTQKKVVGDVKNVVKAVSKLVKKTTGKELEVSIHDSESTYEKAVIDAGGTKQDSGSKGFYLSEDGTIHINMNKATSETMQHEGTHPILDYLAENNPEIIDEFHKQLSEIPGGDKIIKATEKAYEGESETTIKKEAITDFIAKVADGSFEITKTNFEQVRDYIVTTLKKMGIDISKPIENINDLKELAQVISEKFASGEEIKAVIKENKQPEKPQFSKTKVEKMRENDVEERVVSGAKVSTRIPTAKDSPKDSHVSDKYIINLESTKQHESNYIDNALEIANYPTVKDVSKSDISKLKKGLLPKSKGGTESDVKKAMNIADIIYDKFIRSVADNLLWLHDNFDANLRNISKRWYDGANVIAQDYAKKYKVSNEQASGVIAVLSPQMDWYKNVSLAERVLDIVKNHSDFIFDQKMADKYVELSAKIIQGKNESKSEFTKRKEETVNQAKEDIKNLIGKRLDADPLMFAKTLRTYDETYNDKSYEILSPNGDAMGKATNKDGSLSSIGWQGYKVINKAIEIIKDGSQESISTQLGKMHKVRNFYNNISDPNSKNGDITIDTHAVAAGLLKPLAGSDAEVISNLSGGASKFTGATGTYAAFADAYRLAAKERGLLPRQMQSITWEAVRGLFEDTWKTAKNKKLISDIWELNKNKEITNEQARNATNYFAGGIETPTWARSDNKIIEKEKNGDKSEKLSSGSNVGGIGETRRGINPEPKTELVQSTTKVEKSKPQFSKATLPDGKKVETKSMPEEVDVINGFYSPIEKRLIETKIEKQSPNKWLSVIGKGDEAIFTGVKNWLESLPQTQQVSKSEIQNWMKDNRIEINEVVVPKEKTAKERYETSSQLLELPGEKSNYKEILITLPGKNKLTELSDELVKEGFVYTPSGKIFPKTKAGLADVNNYPNGIPISELPQKAKLLAEKIKKNKDIQEFKSSHYDEPNILAHIRMNTRVDAEGNKIVHVEEFQSDYGQEGREKGFVETSLPKEYSIEKDEYNNLYNLYKNGERVKQTINREQAIRYANENKIPTAPFVAKTTDWTKLAWKVALKEAVKQGADKISWTTGEQQNERYSLEKKVDDISAYKKEDGTYEIIARKNNQRTFIDESVPENKLESIVGKELAKKIIEEAGNSRFGKTYEGNDLKVGGTGMKAFYGSPAEGKLGIVGEVAKSLFKQEPKTVEIDVAKRKIGKEGYDIEINKTPSGLYELFYRDNKGELRSKIFDTKLQAESRAKEIPNELKKELQSTQHSIDITPEMRAEVEKGMPQFSKEQPIESKIKDFIEQERAAGETDASIRKGIEEIADQIGIDKNKIDELFQKEAKPKEGAATGIKNAVVEAEREQRGLPQIDKDFLRKTDKTVFDNAQNMIDSGEFNPREQAKYFAENPTEASAEQQMAFEIDRVKIKNELDSLNKDLVAANEKGNKQEAFVIAEKISNLEDAMDLNDRAVTYAGTKIGQALAIRRRLMGLDFSMQKMKSDYYRDNPTATTIPTEIKQKLESFEKEVSDLKGRLEESEKQRKLAEEKQAIESIQGSIEREQNAPPKPAKKISDATKKIADNLRKGKLHSKPSIFSAATPGSLIFDLAIEAASKTIEKSGDIAQALVDGVEIALKTVRDSEWYKGLDKNKQKEAEKGIVDYINDVHSEETGAEKDEKGLSGLQKRVREIVSEGETDINNIVKKIQEEMFPDKSDREIRDAITKYGEQLDVTPDDLTRAVNRANREGVLISKIEDAEQGKRPFRKLLGRDTPTDREREKTRYLNELLKSLPEEETDTYNKIKTATESKVKRLENRVADLKKRIQDLRNGITPEKTVRKPIPDTEDIIKLEKERDELLKEIDGLEVKQQLTDAEYLAKWKDRAKKNITKYEQKIANKDFSTKKQRQPVHTRESAEILAELNAAKKKYKAFREAEQQKTKSNTIKFLETVAKFPRAVILTSTHIFGKLGSFDLGEMVTHPISEAVQALASYIPGIRQIIKGAPMQGGGKFNAKAIVKAYSEFFNPIKLWKDWKSIYKIGLTDQMAKHGSHMPEVVTDYWSKINNAMEISGKSHMMLKAPLLRAKTEMYFTKLQDSYTKNFEKAVEEGITIGEDPSDPQVILAMQGKAFAMAYNDIMLGKNILSTAWNAFVAGLGAPKTEVSGTKAAGKAIEATTRAKIPIVGVPLNFANAVIDYSGLGIGKAIWNMSFAQAKAAKVTGNTFLGEILASGFKNMSEADKEIITKNIKRGSIGAALFIYGYLNKDEIGGVPLPGEKRKPGEIQPFEQIYFGHKLPKWVHLPQLAAIEVGATFGHAMEYYKNQKEKSAVSEATTATIKNLAKSIPFTEEPIRFKKSLNSSEGLSNYFAEFAKSSTIPRDIQEQVLPINQKPKGFIETYTTRKVFKSSDEYERAQLEQEFKDFKEEQKKKKTKRVKEEKEAPKPSNASIAAKAVKFGLKVPTGFFNKR